MSWLQRYDLSFWLLSFSTLLFFFSFNLIIPELPDYISRLGGEDYKGFIIGSFTIAAALSRPFSGKLVDTVGRLPMMYFGGLVCVVAAALYPLFGTVFAFLLLRFFHGLSTGFMPTGTMAYLADIIPGDRRGEAIGIVGMMNNVGFMGGNALSSKVTMAWGIDTLFYLAAVLALISVAILLRLKETHGGRRKLQWGDLRVRLQDVYDPRAKEPAVVMALTTISFGAMLTLIPDYSKGLGIADKGLFLSVTTVSTILIRLLSGRLSDRIGRRKTVLIGTLLWVVACAMLIPLDRNWFFAGAVFLGLATGMNSPSLFAWAVDVAQGVRSGRAMATLFLSMELGITVGSFLSAWVYGNQFAQLSWVFALLCVLNLLAAGFILLRTKAASRAEEISRG